MTALGFLQPTLNSLFVILVPVHSGGGRRRQLHFRRPDFGSGIRFKQPRRGPTIMAWSFAAASSFGSWARPSWSLLSSMRKKKKSCVSTQGPLPLNTPVPQTEVPRNLTPPVEQVLLEQVLVEEEAPVSQGHPEIASTSQEQQSHPQPQPPAQHPQPESSSQQELLQYPQPPQEPQISSNVEVPHQQMPVHGVTAHQTAPFLVDAVSCKAGCTGVFSALVRHYRRSWSEIAEQRMLELQYEIPVALVRSSHQIIVLCCHDPTLPQSTVPHCHFATYAIHSVLQSCALL